MSHGFRLDLSRISFQKRASQAAQKAGQDGSGAPGAAQLVTEPDDEVQQSIPGSTQGKIFDRIVDQDRARSKLELEMLKDIKAIAPEHGDSRMEFVKLDSARHEHAETTLKESVKHHMLINGDTRYLEPSARLKPSQLPDDVKHVTVLNKKPDDSYQSSEFVAHDT